MSASSIKSVGCHCSTARKSAESDAFSPLATNGPLGRDVLARIYAAKSNTHVVLAKIVRMDVGKDAAWQRAFELNLLSTVRLFRGVLPHMREQGWGRIVTVASSSIKQPIDNLMLSNTLRVGILGLAKSLALEVAGDGVLVNTIGPGRIATDRVASLDAAAAERTGRSVEDVRAASEAAIPVGRYGTAEEFAKVAAFLASGANTYVTGQNFLVDGGMVRAL